MIAPLPSAYIALYPSTIKVGSREEAINVVGTNLGSPCPVTKVCGVFSNRVFPSHCGEQLRAIAIAYIIWGSPWNTPDQPLKSRYPTPGSGLFVWRPMAREEHCPTWKVIYRQI